ncbi:RNA-binding protein Musashi 2 [Castilleja foliolosa]|uniref:RNA-binding protein Musashi 2 n=1 Tax=Castilleja foliolosa TaxID=1961234 RepID=A0ABD3BV58_9LAMI
MEEVVEEEFSVWKKNTPLLYDLVICHSLEWPSLTVQWLPSPPSSTSGDLSVHKLILGTHTSDDSPNFLMVADAYLPQDPSSTISIDLDNSIIPKVVMIQKIQVDGEVNRARMSQNEAIIAANTSGTEVHIFDSSKQLASSERGSCDPDLRLRGHDKEGHGLSWSPFKEGYLLSGSNDCRIC